jgi:hypothetical protein
MTDFRIAFSSVLYSLKSFHSGGISRRKILRSFLSVILAKYAYHPLILLRNFPHEYECS